MTPADCTQAVTMFDAAYRALAAQRRGLLAMPDGTDRMLPSDLMTSSAPPSGNVTVIQGEVAFQRDIHQVVSVLAQKLAACMAGEPSATFFRLPAQGLSVVSEEPLLPCRATLTGVNRDGIRIEIAVRV